MEIKYINNKTFSIKGKKESVLVNPEATDLVKNTSRVVLYDVAKYEELRNTGNTVSVMGPGEYEIGGVEINGFSDGHEGTMYTVLVDGVTVGILGKLKEVLSDKKIEKIEGIDVLAFNIDNGDTVGFKVIIGLAKKWGANYLVPIGSEEAILKKFMDEADSEGQEAVESLKVDKDNLPEGMEIVILK